MLTSIAYGLALGCGLVAAAPAACPAPGGQRAFKFPLFNGFPNITVPSDALDMIQRRAQGTLPNIALPTELKPGSVPILQVIAFNEIYEVAFFTSLVQNITNKFPGYEVGTEEERERAISALSAVEAQEELHALGVNAILATAGETPIQPCQYIFPTDTYESALVFAYTFTDLVLGALQDALAGFAAAGDDELLPLFGSVIGQEGEQNGFYRDHSGKIPSALPFLTRTKAAQAFSALNQLVVVPGSCPNADIIGLPVYGALTVSPAAPEPRSQELTFSFMPNGTAPADFSLVYINQQNLPIVMQPQNVKTEGGMVSFSALFPYTENLMNGLTVAVVTSKADSFASVDAVDEATLFGPGLIEIN